MFQNDGLDFVILLILQFQVDLKRKEKDRRPPAISNLTVKFIGTEKRSHADMIRRNDRYPKINDLATNFSTVEKTW